MQRPLTANGCRSRPCALHIDRASKCRAVLSTILEILGDTIILSAEDAKLSSGVERHS
jgi:hypothetical protein